MKLEEKAERRQLNEKVEKLTAVIENFSSAFVIFQVIRFEISLQNNQLIVNFILLLETDKGPDESF